MKVGKLTVLSAICFRKFPCGQMKQIWRCRCDCGNEVEVMDCNLTNPKRHTASCGCLQKLRTARANRTHGKTNHRLYGVWCAMLQRCRTPSCKSYERYGGRGIRVCKRWKKFVNFLKDMEHEFKEGLTLERVANDGNYSPSNCRWATRKEQANNTRRNVQLTYNNKTLSLSEWSNLVGVMKPTVWSRIKRGWTVDMALTTPARRLRCK